MQPIPAGHFEFKVQGIEVEGINMVGVDVQYPWEDSPRRFHRKSFDMKPFFIDTYPVTNAQYMQFIEASGYQPRDRQNYLRHWQGGRPSAEQAKQPVTWVDLTDARAYAQWAGKRLPTSWEWQYAAQGSDGRAYPWGDAWDDGAVPVPDSTTTPASAAPVDALPRGASPFGVMDLVGNVWQWTDEFEDEHTRSAYCAAAAATGPRARTGTSRRPCAWTPTASFC